MIAFFFLIKSTINFSRLVFLNLYKKFAKIRRAEFPLKIANTIQVDSQSYSTHVSHIWNQRRDSITKKRNTGGESASVRFSIELKNFHDSVRFRFAVARPWNVVSLLLFAISPFPSFFIENTFHGKARSTVLRIFFLKNWFSLLLRFGFDFHWADSFLHSNCRSWKTTFVVSYDPPLTRAR